MSASLLDQPETIMPNNDDIRLANESVRQMSEIPLNQRKTLKLTVKLDSGEKTIPIPASLFSFLVDLLKKMATGNAVTIVPLHAVLTTQQAADLLNVSRPFVIQLIESGKLPHHMVGTHRRVRFIDLKNYKTEIDRERKKILDKLTQEAQELDMGY